MADTPFAFDDAGAYHRYMGRWSQAIGEKFLAWLNPSARLDWLEVGCGSGAFTQLIVEQARPASVIGIDPSSAQVEHAARTVTAPQAQFRIGSATELPFDAGTFDIVVSALVIHFIGDRPLAFREMLRVAKPGAMVCGYTWRKSPTIVDAPYGPLARAIVEVAGDVKTSPAVPEALPEGVRATLAAQGFEGIDTATIDVSQTFRDFEDYWISQTATFPHPVAKSAMALNDRDRERVRGILRATLPAAADGSITYASRASAFKARKPR
ncbi:MAG TPA: methyltransferase domain-containing protein [Vicinamibacterales bacterium]|nr:methyltransferase domain-containing protein [Vicinamibacterales bacterium]